MTDTKKHAEALKAVLLDACGVRGRDWLESCRQRLQGHAERIFELFPAVGRKLGRSSLLTEESAPRPLETEWGPLDLRAWTRDDAGRFLLIAEVDGDHGLAERLYRQGELRERVACVRSLALLPGGDAGLSFLTDACRTNTLPLYEAAICENPYASHRLPDALFWQCVLKAAFMGVRLERIVGLSQRSSPELSRMLTSYVTERMEAGRSVPHDLWPVIALHPRDDTLAHLARFSAHEFGGHRYYAARALGIAKGERARAILEARSESESDPRVKEALAEALQQLEG